MDTTVTVNVSHPKPRPEWQLLMASATSSLAWPALGLKPSRAHHYVTGSSVHCLLLGSLDDFWCQPCYRSATEYNEINDRNEYTYSVAQIENIGVTVKKIMAHTSKYSQRKDER